MRVIELYRSGYLIWIEVHLLSLGSLARMGDVAKVSDGTGAIAVPVPPTTH